MTLPYVTAVLCDYAEVCPNEDEFGRMSASEADKIAQSYSSKFPHFAKVMKGFNVGGSYTLVGSSYIFFMSHRVTLHKKAKRIGLVLKIIQLG